MEYSQLLQPIGLFLDTVGVLIMFVYSPVNKSGAIFAYGREQTEEQEKQAHEKNLFIKGGLIILLFGFLLQAAGVAFSIF
jgi:hypothetical protein